MSTVTITDETNTVTVVERPTPEVIVVTTSAVGPPGPAGPTGPAGPAGPTGATGATGPQGPAGATGATGATGPAGPEGPEGPQGPQGDPGPAGDAGPEGPQGDPGPAGTDGRTILSGSGAPSGGTGEDGDFYLDTSASALYGPKAAGSWPSGVSLVGPTGATGGTGPQGPAGPEGPSGAAMSRKQGLWQFTDLTHATQTGIFVGAAITSGSPFDSLIAGDLDSNHQGVTRFSAASAQANSGYRWNTDARYIGASGLASRVVFRAPPSFSPVRECRFGFFDSTNTGDPTDCAMIFVAGAGVAKGRVRANGTAAETGTTYSLAVDTWYTFDVDYTADDTVRFSISNDAGTLLWQDSITDAQVPNTLARVFFCGMAGWRTTSGAADQIGALDYIAVGPERPSWEAVPT
jgi:hypothetical protein